MGVPLADDDKDAEAVRGFMGLSLRDMATDSLTRAGVSVRGLPVLDVFERAAQHSTSDFPLIVADSMTSVALASYRASESALKQLCRRRSLVNFKDSTSIRLGEMGQLEKLDEGGEIRHTSRAEAGEKMALETYARGISLSRTLLLNDDLGMLADTVSALGAAAAQTEASILAGRCSIRQPGPERRHKGFSCRPVEPDSGADGSARGCRPHGSPEGHAHPQGTRWPNYHRHCAAVHRDGRRWRNIRRASPGGTCIRTRSGT